MSRVLLATSLFAALPIAAQAGSISVLQELKGSAPSIIQRGTPAEPQVETVTVKSPTKDEIKRVVTPMVMRGGVSGGVSPEPGRTVSAAPDRSIVAEPETEFVPETTGGKLE